MYAINKNGSTTSREITGVVTSQAVKRTVQGKKCTDFNAPNPGSPERHSRQPVEGCDDDRRMGTPFRRLEQDLRVDLRLA